MKIKVIKKNNRISLSDDDINEIERIIKFDKHGKYYSKGRTCYYHLITPININNTLYSYVKLKGCGCYESDKLFIKPGEKSFIRRDPHFGIDELGYPKMAFSDIAPYGGILLDRAINEYNNFDILNQNSVSSLIPMYVYKYDEIKFSNKELGVSISLCEDTEPLRMDKLLYTNELMPKEYKDYYKKIFELEFLTKTNLDLNDKERLIKRIAYYYGSEIRKFCNSGLYIHSGGWSNIQYSFKNKNVVLIDLDSSRKNNNESLELLLNCRDLVSNIYRLFINLYNPNCIKDYTENEIRKTNYIFFILKGFFKNICDSKLLFVSNNINDYYINNCFNRIKSIEKIMLNMTDEDAREYELDIMSFYDYCMNEISNLLYEERNLNIYNDEKFVRYKRR